MKKLILSLSLLLAGAMSLSAQEKGFRVVADDWQHLAVEFTVGEPRVGETLLCGERFSTLAIDGYQEPLDNFGSPALPTFSRLIEVPVGADFKVTVSEAVYDTLKALPHRLMPVQLPRRKSDTSAMKLFVSECYLWNAFIGQREALVEAVGIARDRRLARLQFSPVRYNPVSGEVIVCRHATVTVDYQDGDEQASKELFERYYSPAFNNGANVINSLYPKAVSTTAPVRYLIVAHSMFRGQLDNFVQWKRRKGFITDIVYTDDAGVGTTTTSIQAYIQSQYANATAANPAPTYLLLVGDVAQIPAFNGTTQNSHITDLYYTTWTSGDNIPDCYHGRFSAQNFSQLEPQIAKTLMYEQYTFADPTFLDRAVMVAGVDGGSAGDYGYTHADPAMDYAITNYINGAHGWSQVMYFKNNTSIVPTGSNVTIGSSSSNNAATVRSYYNQGAGWINYSAHGGSSGWGTPSFNTTNVEQMTNSQKFGILIGNCCQSNMFGENNCFGEALLRKGDYCGAVGYIGGSDYTYWGEDFYWAVGLRSNIGPSMSMAYNSSNLGAYDRICHTHGEANNQWATSQGSLMMMGNMAVQSSSSSLKQYYWEIYHLMGDPSVMTYLTQASMMTLTAPQVIIPGTESITVSAVPYAYVALTNATTHALVSSAFADASGTAVLQIPSAIAVGSYELAASAQQYRTAFTNIDVLTPQGAYVTVSALSSAQALDAGTSVMFHLEVTNYGAALAEDVVVHLTSGDPALTLALDSVLIDSISASSTYTVAIPATVAQDAVDGTLAAVQTTTTWQGATNVVPNSISFLLNAPVLTIRTTSSSTNLMPGTSATLNVEVSNIGHAALPSTTPVYLTVPTSLMGITAQGSGTIGVAPAGTESRQFTLQADASLPTGIFIPVTLHIGSLSTVRNYYIGSQTVEGFESGSFPSGWTQGQNPWTIVTDTYHSGSHAARSKENLGHNNTSEFSFTHTALVSDSISFYYRVSSESNYDKFHFYMDNNELVVASGDVDWTRAAFPVQAGSHTYTFTYQKDYSVDNGSDCAWVDDISLPRTAHPVTYLDADLCVGELYVVGNDTVNTTAPGSGCFAFVGSDQSVTIVNYTVNSAVFTDTVVNGCDSLMYAGQIYFESDVIVSTFQSETGCDSVSRVLLNIYPSVTDTMHASTQADCYYWGDSAYTISGEYSRLLTTVHGCDSIAVLVLTIGNPSGIGGVEGLTITPYPNPTGGMLMFGAEVEQLTVYSLDGREMLQARKVRQIDLSSLPQGSYLLRIATVEGSATVRVSVF